MNACLYVRMYVRRLIVAAALEVKKETMSETSDEFVLRVTPASWVVLFGFCSGQFQSNKVPPSLDIDVRLLLIDCFQSIKGLLRLLSVCLPFHVPPLADGSRSRCRRCHYLP